MKTIHIDPDSSVVAEHYAVVYVPSKHRGRFSENCVAIVKTAEEALSTSDSDKKTYPAKVVGPSKSSEGVRLFYLEHWLDEKGNRNL